MTNPESLCRAGNEMYHTEVHGQCTFVPDASLPRVGIEIENESRSVNTSHIRTFLRAQRTAPPMSNATITPLWDMVGEGSLRAGPYGWELVTRNEGGGMDYETAVHALHQLYPLLSDCSGSWRAAVHVHVNVLSLSMSQLSMLLALCYACDRAMFENFSPERVESNFCEPLIHKQRWVLDTIRSLADGRSIRSAYGKYSSVNMGTVERLGSVEFRHMRTPETDSAVPSISKAIGKIKRYLDACVTIVQVAANVHITDQGLQQAIVAAASWLDNESMLHGWINWEDLGWAVDATQYLKPVGYTDVDIASVAKVARS